MKELEFEKLLFNSAVCVMACDGKIHEDELTELKLIATQTPYFRKLDYEHELSRILNDIKINTNIMKLYFNTLKEADLSPSQEMLLLEVILRMMYSDNRIDENEVRFVKIVKKYLDLPDQIIFDRFGKINFLIKGYEEISQKDVSYHFPKITLTEIQEQLDK